MRAEKVEFREQNTIVEDLGKGRYKLKDGNGKVLTRAYNCHRLKLWLEPNEKAETEPNSKSNANQKWRVIMT